MDSQISAKLAEGSYILGQARKLGDGYENVNKHVADLGYEVIPQYSNRNITIETLDDAFSSNIP